MTQYAMGWHPSLPDFRDKKYSAPAGLVLPPKIDLSAGLGSPFNPAKDQGEIGSCGPNTLAKNILFDSMKDGDKPSFPSRLFLYYVTRSLMGTLNSDSGVDNRTMMKALKQFGWPDESVWPYDTSKFKLRPSQDAFSQAAARAGGIQYLAVSGDLNSMKACLAEGFPFVFGFSVYSSMMSQGVERTGVVPMPTFQDSLVGGHDVLIVGYDDATGRFKFQNHWLRADGSLWGDAGYGYIPYAYATNPMLASDFWTVRADGYVNPLVPDPTPVPVPPIPPGPSNMPTLQQFVDSLFDALKQVYPEWSNVIDLAKSLVDQYLFHVKLNATAVGTSPQEAIDSVFDAIIAAAPNIYLRVLLQVVKTMADKYLSQNTAKLMAKLSA